MKNKADGSTVAAPIWQQYMEDALAGTPVETFTTPQPIVTDVGSDAFEPGTDAVGLAELRPRLPGLLQGILHGVLGLASVAQEVSGEAIRSGDLGLDQAQERLRLAGGGLGQRQPRRSFFHHALNSRLAGLRPFQTESRRGKFDDATIAGEFSGRLKIEVEPAVGWAVGWAVELAADPPPITCSSPWLTVRFTGPRVEACATDGGLRYPDARPSATLTAS